MSKYEAHVTFRGEDGEKVQFNVNGWAADSGWKFSRMVDDPILGPGEHCYVTTHDIDEGFLRSRIAVLVTNMRSVGLNPVRSKIELDVFDERY